MNNLPCAKKFNCIAASYPILNHVCCSAVSLSNITFQVAINELICLSNMESLNAVFIEQGIPQGERLVKLNQIAIQQIKVLESGSIERKLLK